MLRQCGTVFYVHETVHLNKFLFNKTNRHNNFPNLFLSRDSTCFGHFLCPKHVEFLDKSKFEKLVCLLIIKKKILELFVLLAVNKVLFS